MKKIFTLFAAMLAVSAMATEPITFEDATLEKEQVLNNAGVDEVFTFGDLYFTNYYVDYGSFAAWNGFAVSKTTGNTFVDYNDNSQYNSIVGGGYNGSETFMVGYYSEYNYWSDDQAPAITSDGLITPVSAYFVNTANAASYFVKNGYGADHFLTLTITGYDEDYEETGSVDVDLFANGVAMNEWTLVDLSPIGECFTLEFTMDCVDTDKSGGFMNAPSYFCMDNLVATVRSTPSATENAAAAVRATKRLINGQLIITRDGKTYNVMGQQF